jgi:dihydroorotate dehydrogenase electron transfer subunit
MIAQDTKRPSYCGTGRQAPGYYRMGLACDIGFDSAKPGQFVMVRIGIGSDPLLRRPFSLLGLIHEQDRVTGIEILYQSRGQGHRTAVPMPQTVTGCPSSARWAMPFWCPKLPSTDPRGRRGRRAAHPLSGPVHAGTQEGLDRCVVFVGGRTKDDLVCITEFDLPGFLLDISTDDGSQGNQGW